MILGYTKFDNIAAFEIAHDEAKIYNGIPIICRNKRSGRRIITKQQTIAVADYLPKLRGILDSSVCCIIIDTWWPSRLLNSFTYLTRTELDDYLLIDII